MRLGEMIDPVADTEIDVIVIEPAVLRD